MYGKFVSRADQVPQHEHWAIITPTSVYIPGDERSRTNPGHGYPDRTEEYITYEAFTNEQEFLGELQKRGVDSYKRLFGIHITGIYLPQPSVEVKRVG